jgi:hypothetical protein
MKIILLFVFLFTNCVINAQFGNNKVEDLNGVSIIFSAYKLERFENKSSVCYFEVKCINNTNISQENFCDSITMRTLDNINVNQFYVSPVLNVQIKPLDTISGLFVYKSDQNFANKIFITKKNNISEVIITEIKGTFNKIFESECIALNLKIKFDLDNFSIPTIQMYDSLKSNFENENHYLFDKFIKYEIMGDYKRGVEKPSNTKEIYDLYKTSYIKGNKDPIFLERKYYKYKTLLYNQIIDTGFKNYNEKDFNESYINFTEAYNIDSTKSDSVSLVMKFELARSIFSLWEKDKNIDIEFSLYLLTKLINNKKYPDQCQVLFLNAWIHDKRYSDLKNSSDKEIAINFYTKILEMKELNCSEKITKAASNNKEILEKE